MTPEILQVVSARGGGRGWVGEGGLMTKAHPFYSVFTVLCEVVVQYQR